GRASTTWCSRRRRPNSASARRQRCGRPARAWWCPPTPGAACRSPPPLPPTAVSRRPWRTSPRCSTPRSAACRSPPWVSAPASSLPLLAYGAHSQEGNCDAEDRLKNVGVSRWLLRRPGPRTRLATGRRRTAPALQRVARRGGRVPGRAGHLRADGRLLADRRPRSGGFRTGDRVRPDLAGHAEDRVLP